jgi:hypothetical protein
MKKIFSRESMPQIKAELEKENKPDRQTMEKIIKTIRTLVLYDRKKEYITESWESTDHMPNNSSWDLTIENDGGSSDFGEINIKVYNTYSRDHSEDPMEDSDEQTVEIKYKDELVFEAQAHKKVTYKWMNIDDTPDAELKNFRLIHYKEGPWILPILQLSMKEKFKKALGANKIKA